MKVSMSFVSSLALLGSFHINSAVGDSPSLPNGCINKEDGDHWLQLSQSMPDDMMPLNLRCSNEYVILNPEKDSNLLDYFVNFDDWKKELSSAWQQREQLSWTDYFLPCSANNNDVNEAHVRFIFSKDCQTCDKSKHYDASTMHGHFCVCYKPGDSHELKEFQLTEKQQSFIESRGYENVAKNLQFVKNAKNAKNFLENELENDIENENEDGATPEADIASVGGAASKGAKSFTNKIDEWLDSLQVRLIIIGCAVTLSVLLTGICYRIHFRSIFEQQSLMEKQKEIQNQEKRKSTMADDSLVSMDDNEKTPFISKYGSV